MAGVDPVLAEDVRHALALLRPHLTADEQAWEALREVGDLGQLADSLCKIAGVLVLLLVPVEARLACSVHPATVDQVLAIIAAGFAPGEPT